MARSSAAEPTEAPSARRLRAARRQGLVAASRDLSEALAFLALVVVMAIGAPRGLAQLWRLFRAALSASLTAPGTTAAAAARALDVAAALTLLPLAPVLVVGVLATALQTGGLFSWSAAAPDLGRLSPRAAFARLGAGPALGALARMSAKVALLSLSAGFVLAPLFRRLPALAGATPRAVVAALGVSARSFGLAAATVLIAWGVLDWALARRRHRLSLMMTRAEALRERRETEGNVLPKAERARRHRELGERGAVEDVRSADFVVTDGGQVAVAVRYDRAGGRAPIVVARAERLRAAALEQRAYAAGVPLHIDGALARALAAVSEGEEIPEATFQAVADLLRASWPAAGAPPSPRPPGAP